LSALDADEVRTAASGLRPEHHLTKPFSCRGLLECIRACLRTEQPDAARASAAAI
jgi:DNA-binding response OmpR family regulator